MISLQEQYTRIAKSENKLILEVIESIVDRFKVSKEEFKEEPKYYIRKALYEIKANNDRVISLRLKRKKLNDDISDLERAYCAGDSCESTGEGRNTGGRTNNVEKRQIRKLKMREQLGQLVMETKRLEEHYSKDNELIIQFMKIIPQQQYVEVLILSYIDCLNQSEIAIELQTTSDWVKLARARGVSSLVQIVKKCI